MVPHYTLGRFAPGAAAHNPEYIIFFLAAFAVVMFITAYVSSALGAMLKRREGYLSRLHDELRLWNIQIRQANERLIEIDRTKTDFMRMSAHEIRSPMAAMLSILNTIIGGYVDDKDQIMSMLKILERSLLERTGNLALVQHSLGHRHISTTTIYAHVPSEELQQAMETL